MNLIQAIFNSEKHEARRKGWPEHVTARFFGHGDNKTIEIENIHIGMEKHPTKEEWNAEDWYPVVVEKAKAMCWLERQTSTGYWSSTDRNDGFKDGAKILAHEAIKRINAANTNGFSSSLVAIGILKELIGEK